MPNSITKQPAESTGELIFIENEGALFRGPARGVPTEVWNSQERKFLPYKLAGQPKPIDWGHVIDDEQVQQLMA